MSSVLAVPSKDPINSAASDLLKGGHSIGEFGELTEQLTKS